MTRESSTLYRETIRRHESPAPELCETLGPA